LLVCNFDELENIFLLDITLFSSVLMHLNLSYYKTCDLRMLVLKHLNKSHQEQHVRAKLASNKHTS
jgi:hypothetical protein